MMHRVLARQLRRVGLSSNALPEDLEEWRRFLTAVEDAYEDTDRNHYLLERSLQISTKELTEVQERLFEQARALIERSEARFKDLFNLSPIPTWEENFGKVEARLEDLRADGVTDIAQHLRADPSHMKDLIGLAEVTNVNPAVGELVRTEDLVSLIGPVSPDLVDEENFAAWLTQIEAIWEGRGYVRIDPMVGHRLDGEVFHGILEWHAPLIFDHHDYSRVVVTIIDITDRINAEQKLQSVLKSKDEFLASISHELRTPLTSVLGFAEVLRAMDADTSEEERESLLEIIASEAADLSNIVEDLLVAARAELGQLTVATVPVDVYAQIAQVTEGRSASQKEIEVRRDGQRLVAKGDPQRVRQILRNLISNADRYGGDKVFVESEVDSEVVRVKVCDDGGGLAPELMEQVFERYYRIQRDRSQPGSVGVGLTISRDLARLMGGDLHAEQGDGLTIFVLTLPRAT